jgi:hypothetical protein
MTGLKTSNGGDGCRRILRMKELQQENQFEADENNRRGENCVVVLFPLLQMELPDDGPPPSA